MDGSIKRLRRGLTLLEIILAIGIVAVAILAMILVFTKGLRLVSQSSQVTGATQVARQMLEVVKERGYAQITTGNYDGTVPDLPNGTTGFPPLPYPSVVLNKIEYTISVEATTAGMPANLIAVKVDVFWNARSKVTMQTYIRP